MTVNEGRMVDMARKRSEEKLERYSVLVPESVDAQLRQMAVDAGERVSDTVRRILKAGVSPEPAFHLSDDLTAAVELASSLSGMTADQVVCFVLRAHLGEVIEGLKASSDRLALAMKTPGKNGGGAGTKR